MTSGGYGYAVGAEHCVRVRSACGTAEPGTRLEVDIFGEWIGRPRCAPRRSTTRAASASEPEVRADHRARSRQAIADWRARARRPPAAGARARGGARRQPDDRAPGAAVARVARPAATRDRPQRRLLRRAAEGRARSRHVQRAVGAAAHGRESRPARACFRRAQADGVDRDRARAAGRRRAVRARALELSRRPRSRACSHCDLTGLAVRAARRALRRGTRARGRADRAGARRRRGGGGARPAASARR